VQPFLGRVISRKRTDTYRYALIGWEEGWGTMKAIWLCVKAVVYALSVRKGSWNLENGVSSTSLRNPWARTLRLATGVLLLPQYNPLVLAEDASIKGTNTCFASE
jgi:hypothetical protein